MSDNETVEVQEEDLAGLPRLRDEPCVGGDVVPCVSRERFLEEADKHDLGSSKGKQAIWKLLSKLGSEWKNRFTDCRNSYSAEGYSVGEANLRAVEDIAALLPSVEAEPDVSLGSGGKVFRKHPRRRSLAPRGETVLDRAIEEVYRRWERSAGDKKRVQDRTEMFWVANNLGRRIERVIEEPTKIPSPSALFMLLWAKDNESQWRKDYHSAPYRASVSGKYGGEPAAALIDAGAPIDDMLGRMESG